jgi:DNA-binding beta-propeller fold protein YncE
MNVSAKPRTAAALLALAASLAAAPYASAEAQLTLERTIPLKDVSGRIDHMAVDLKRQRLIVAELGNDTVEIIDLGSGEVVHRLAGLKEPQGVGYVADGDLIAVASAGDGTVRLFNSTSFAPAGTISLGEDADNVRVDAKTGQLVVGYGDGALAFIDPRQSKVTGTVKLKAHPESFQLSPDGSAVFVNVPDAREIAVVDRSQAKQGAGWKIGDARSNFPMALTNDGFVASVFRSPARLTVFRQASGEAAASLATCGDADDVFFDGKRRRFYVSCGEGAVDVIGWGGKAAVELGRVATASGARTSLFVPELDRLFVASRAGLLGSSAAILVFRPAP